ncbi:TonB-dependent receptor [Sphingomonas nostoxanthinifaciens]|uniref:TonB-dependent receptor n=1 Tax=Sphingomonas nostoxanthinifaciens TaxID=2872652 RepID=UPI001CC1D784|nr:TonB-dependent receptor [Sphingomonas nostoxanthinifaciens]UAK22850.1 TonB-dependent receptor [Sphingomonas nostoxanthinifaciens]
MKAFYLLLCTTAAIPVGVSAQTAPQSIDNTAANNGGTIVITGRLEATARQEQAAAPNLVNIQPAETIAKYPDVNAAEALGRVPGVALSIDTGEGRFVNIRGLDGNLNGATLGGVVLLNTQPGGTYFNGSGRAVEFDTVPIGAIDRISVIKTGLPDHEAEGLGGSIELTPRTAIGLKKPFADITLGGGYEPLHSSALYRDEVVLGAPVGHNVDGNALFSFVVTQFLYNDRRAVDDVEAAYKDDQANGVPDKAFDALELRRYDYHRRRFGYSGEFDLTPNANNRIYARVSIAGYNEHAYRNRLVLSGLGDAVTVDPANANGLIATGVSATKTLRDYDETHRNTVFQIGGEHHLGIFKLDWFGAYSRATYDKHYDYNSTFAGPTGLTVAYDNTTNPNYPSYSVVSGGSITNSANYALDNIVNQPEHDRDQEWSYAANLSASPGLTAGDEIKIGGKLRYRHKTANPYGWSSDATGNSLTGLQSGGPYTYYDGHYMIGSGLAGDALRGLFLQGATGSPVLNAGGSFDDNEDVSAGYAQYDGTFGALGVLAGVRVEHTSVTYRGIATTTQADGSTLLTPQSQHHTYTNVFPTVQLRYQIAPKLVGRATYSTGIARPGFYQTIQSANVDVGNQAVAIGNPALKPTTGQNFDASLEYYLPGNGIVSLGFFDKEFSNYIVARTTRGSYPGFTGIFTVDSYQNISGAHARGIEAAFVNRFAGLPGLLSGLGVDSNFTYVTSSAAVRGGEHVTLPGTFKYTGNAAVFYERERAKLRLSGQYESAVLFGIGANRATDIFQDKRFTLDLTGSYQLTKRVELYANVKNLTNAPLRFYEGSSNRPIQREFYDVTIEGGVKVHL